MENLILKTGFNNLDDDSQSDEIKLQMTALITVFMENALKTAEIYTKEANRKVITPQDISLSLKRELFTFLDNDDIEQRSLEILNEFKAEIANNEEESFNSEDENDEEEEVDSLDSEYDYDEQNYVATCTRFGGTTNSTLAECQNSTDPCLVRNGILLPKLL